MPDIWIALDAAARRGLWRLIGLATVLFAVVGVFGLRAAGTAMVWWVAGIIVGPWLVMLLGTVHVAYGRTLLTAEGIGFHTLFRHRAIPWREITDLEEHRHIGRRSWSEVHVHRVRGRALAVPGTYSAKWGDRALKGKLETMRYYRSQTVVPLRDTPKGPDGESGPFWA